MDLRQSRTLRNRLNVFQALAWLMILGLAVVYGWLQLVRSRELQRLAQQQAIKVRTTPAPRGIIFDRNGYRLVDNRRALHLVIQKEDLATALPQAEALAAALEVEPDLLRRRISLSRGAGGNKALRLLDNLDEAGLAQAERLRARFPFLSIEVAPSRVYQGDELAGHVIGYVGEVTPEVYARSNGRFQLNEIVGRSGFELSRNEQLKGEDGQRRILVDHLGREVALFGLHEAKPGRSVYLTLDAGLQKVLMDSFGEEQGAGVVIDLRDGGILAMVSSPGYDPNIFLHRLEQETVDLYFRNPSRPLLNRATQGLYPPGSTYKLLVALCALEKGIITPETVFHCAGRKTYYGREFRCDGVHGSISLVQAIAHSCDIYFYELGMRLDVDDIYATAAKYGLATPTGVDLPHELGSRIPNREWKRRNAKRKVDEKWYAGETISVAIGQGQNGLTPLALARFYAALATKGKLLTPHLLYGVRSDETSKMEVAPLPPAKETGLDPRIWAALNEGMIGVVKYGTAKDSNDPRLGMAGKTGTSQVTTFVDKQHYAKLAKKFKDNALFAGYAPYDNPQIAFAVVVENAGFGAKTAAPLARRLCQYWLVDRLKQPLPPPGGKLPDAFEKKPEEEESTAAETDAR
ncbi:MAG: penicillin-binding protein 2 [Holophagaceae bacterium]